MHRDPIGEIKTMTVKRDRVGDWFIVLTAELPDTPQRTPSSAVGIDLRPNQTRPSMQMGSSSKRRSSFISPRRRLKRAQRNSVAKQKAPRTGKGPHQGSQDSQENSASKGLFPTQGLEGARIRADLLVFEDLPIANMVKNHPFSKSIYDASWGKLYQYASYKASSAGKSAVRADPGGQHATARAETR